MAALTRAPAPEPEPTQKALGPLPKFQLTLKPRSQKENADPQSPGIAVFDDEAEFRAEIGVALVLFEYQGARLAKLRIPDGLKLHGVPFKLGFK